ncbi:hypothetical protein LBW89_20665 [Paenibacillus sp. alder61]|uniref:Uncharacterized protein n=1 Tax=Paenibacillus faecis TaxID=862114 RepID=A0A5D0CYY4_9BACL|nr:MULTISPECIES: hypothetical protein [Paenibacillus]MCA1295424.1 hypothetical protein [Paenibacillus sp. alder61]TYA14504.1 hypothetical protein FRY98_02115 [Paenibacillus faecis]
MWCKIKKVVTLSLFFIVVIIGILYISNKATYTSLKKEVMDEISLTNLVKVSFRRYSDDKGTIIKDERRIEQMLAELSDIELKKVRNISADREYEVRIYLKDKNLGFEVTEDLNYMVIFKESGHQLYKVLDGKNHLKMIEALDYR